LFSSMDALDLQKLGLNRNEAKVYYALIQKGTASAADLVHVLGIHRNIVYDNIEKLIEKGLVSYVIIGTKKMFKAEAPQALIEYLNSKKNAIDDEINTAQTLIPQINLFLKTPQTAQETTLFRGVKGIKKVLSEVLEARENWVIGMSNASVDILTSTYWKNYNAKADDRNNKEHFLLNADFKDDYSFASRKNIKARRLPPELTQITEIIMFNDSVAIFIYSEEPIVVLIKNKHLFTTFRKQFDFFWKLCKREGRT
jgi:sugar-specific transcriptional regulator TrmB